MCGLFGIVLPPSSFVDRSVLQVASRALRHRGPDDEGYLLASSTQGTVISACGPESQNRGNLKDISDAKIDGFNVGFVFRRLAILDLSSAGHQPMCSSNRRYWIIFNGEIYNYLELRRELEPIGYHFTTGTDTEVLLAAFCEWGTNCFSYLEGMFAIAVLDTWSWNIFFARDHFGIKPLYYCPYKDGIAFASEASVLLSLPGVDRTASPSAIYQYLRFGERVAGPSTMMGQISQIQAAHWAQASISSPSNLSTHRYWTIPNEILDIEEAEARRIVEELFYRSVGLHLRADVPVGICLSGGFDSTAIALAARQQLPSTYPLKAFSYISDSARLSEEPFVDLVGGVISHKVTPTLRDFQLDIDDVIKTQDFPFLSLSVYAQYCVFRVAHECGIKVMLDGQGADEIFCGYSSHYPPRLASLLRQQQIGRAFNIFMGANPSSPRWLLKATLARFLPATVRWPRAIFRQVFFPRWLNQKWYVDREVEPSLRPLEMHSDPLFNEIRSGITDLSLPQLLRYEDRNSMRFSIESRVPFCNHKLVNFAACLPAHFMISSDGEAKHILKSALSTLVPDSIRRRPKLGFDATDAAWLNSAPKWIDARFRYARDHRVDCISIGHAETLVRDSLRRNDAGVTTAWRILNLLAWSEKNNVSWN